MNEDLLKTLQGIYDELADAFRDQDLERIAGYIADGWTGETGGKKVTREQLIENVRHLFETLKDISWPRTVTLLDAEGDPVVVRAAGVFRGTDRGSGETVEQNLANLDVWALGPKGWQNVSSTSLSE